MEVGQIVCSTAGHDKNCLMVIIGEKDGKMLIADGKSRSLYRPKTKNPRHISVTGDRISTEKLTSNKSLRRALSAYRRQREEIPLCQKKM